MINRLASQVGDRKLAIKILIDRGHLKKDGKTFTEEGKKRNMMTAEERAKDRAAKYSGLPASSFEYNKKTNRARIKK